MIQDDLQATASLARLDLSEDEAAAALPAFELMLEYFAAMKAADGDEGLRSLADSSRAVPATFFRSDAPANSNSNPAGNSPLNNLASELMNRAPESENGFFVLPNVL